MNKTPVFFILGLCLLPFAVALFSLSWPWVLLLVILLLFGGWLARLKALKPMGKNRPLILESISASHFVEKVRWSLDRLGVDYREHTQAGILGVLTQRRTVPRLFIPTGIVYSQIGNSSDILRYLWGRYGATLGDRVAFLEPTSASLELESQLDVYGVNLQIWLYSQCLSDRRFTLKVWGLGDRHVPFSQKVCIFLFRPILSFLLRKAFGIRRGTKEHFTKKVEAMLETMETRLADGREFLMGGDELTFVDITFASLSGIWAFPEGYANGRAVDTIPPPDIIPASLREDIERWKSTYPRVHNFIERLYQAHRAPQAGMNQEKLPAA